MHLLQRDNIMNGDMGGCDSIALHLPVEIKELNIEELKYKQI